MPAVIVCGAVATVVFVAAMMIPSVRAVVVSITLPLPDYVRVQVGLIGTFRGAPHPKQHGQRGEHGADRLLAGARVQPLRRPADLPLHPLPFQQQPEARAQLVRPLPALLRSAAERGVLDIS